jgi:hypothetical protein
MIIQRISDKVCELLKFNGENFERCGRSAAVKVSDADEHPGMNSVTIIYCPECYKSLFKHPSYKPIEEL